MHRLIGELEMKKTDYLAVEKEKKRLDTLIKNGIDSKRLPIKPIFNV